MTGRRLSPKAEARIASLRESLANAPGMHGVTLDLMMSFAPQFVGWQEQAREDSLDARDCCDAMFAFASWCAAEAMLYLHGAEPEEIAEGGAALVSKQMKELYLQHIQANPESRPRPRRTN